jgi:virginiamycin B lyase
MDWRHPEILVIVASLSLVPPAARGQQASIAEISLDALRVQAEVPKPGSNLAFGFDSLWVVHGTAVTRVLAADNSFIDIPIEGATGRVRDLAVGEGGVWVPDVGNRTIYKIDPLSDKVVQRISAEMFGAAGSIGVGEGSVWVVTGNDRVLTRFSATTGKVEARIALPGDSAGVTVEYGSVWVTGNFRGELYRIDPKTNAIVQTTALGRIPRSILSAYGSIWVFNWGSGTVQKIDPVSGRVTATIKAGLADDCGSFVAGGHYLWVLQSGTPVVQIDPGSEAAIRKISGMELARAIRFGAGSLWLAGESIKRIEEPN